MDLERHQLKIATLGMSIDRKLRQELKIIKAHGEKSIVVSI